MKDFPNKAALGTSCIEIVSGSFLFIEDQGEKCCAVAYSSVLNFAEALFYHRKLFEFCKKRNSSLIMLKGARSKKRDIL